MSLIKNTFAYSLGRLLPQLSALVLLPIYSVYLSTSEYGIVQAMQALSPILAILFSLATERSMARLFFDYKNENDQKIFVGNVFILVSSISIFSTIALFFFNQFVEQIYSNIPFFPYFSLTILTSVIVASAQIPFLVLQIHQKALNFLIISTIQFLLMVSFILFFVVIKHEGAIGLLKGQLIGNLFFIPIVIYYTKKYSIFKLRFKMIKSVWKYSLPLIPSFVFAWVINLSDRIFVEQFVNLNQVGIYAMGAKIAQSIMLFTGAFTASYSPIFYKLANSAQPENAKKQLQTYQNTFVILSLLLTFLLILFSKDLLYFLIAPQYSESLLTIIILSLTNFIGSVSGMLNFMIYQEKKTTVMMWLTIISAAINLILNYFLIKYFHIIGAALSTLFTIAIFFVLKYSYAQKFYFIPFNFKQIGLWFVVLILLLVFIYLLPFTIYQTLPIKIVLALAVGLFFYYRFAPQKYKVWIFKN